MRGLLLGGIVATLLMGGCNATHVVYVHNATLGVDLTVASETTTRLSIGFDRETFALVPKYTKKNTAKPAADEKNKADAGNGNGDQVAALALLPDQPTEVAPAQPSGQTPGTVADPAADEAARAAALKQQQDPLAKKTQSKQSAEEEPEDEAMTVTAISRVKTQGMGTIRFSHVVATGKAAINLAKRPAALQQLAKKIFEAPPKSSLPEKAAGGGQ